MAANSFKGRILIVDDDPDLTEFIKIEFEKENYYVQACQKGQTAIASCKKENYDIGLIDYKLPNYTGVDLIRKIEKIQPAMEYVIITGYASLDNAIEAFQHEKILYYEDKPINFNRLVSFVNQRIEKTRVEKTLRENERKFRQIFNNVNDAIYLWKLDENGRFGKFIEVNDVACNRLGYSKRQLKQMTLYDIVDPEEEHYQDQIRKKLIEDEYITCETRHKRKDGSHFPAELNCHLFSMKEEPYILTVSRDITKRKQVERELRASKGKYKALYINAPLAYQSLDRNGNIIDVNPAWLETLGYKRGEVVGKWFGDFLHPEFKSPFKAEFKAFKERGYIHEIEFKIRHENGDYLWVSFEGRMGYNPDGSVEQSYCVFEDITERKEARQKLQESEEKYRNLFETMAQGVVYQNAKGEIISANPKAHRILDYEQGQLIGKTLGYDQWEVVDEEKNKIPLKKLPPMIALETGHKVEKVTLGVFNPEEEKYVWLIVSSIPQFKNNEQQPSQVYTTFLDITDKKRAEKQLQYQSGLRKLLIDLSLTFINIPLKNVDAAINDSLARLGNFVDADRVYVFDYDFENNTCTNTYEWCAAGIEPQIDNLQAVPLEEIPNWVETHSQGKNVYIPDVFDLPDQGLRAILEEQDIKSLLTLPIIDEGDCLGFVGFDSVKEHHSYSRQDQQLLEVFAEMILNIQLRKKMEKEKSQLQKQLLQAQKLKSIGSLGGGIAHDYNNKLAVIQGRTEMAMQRIGRKNPAYPQLKAALETTKEASKLTRKILLFSRKQELFTERMNLNQTIQELQKVLNGIMNENIKLETGLAKDLAAIEADKDQLEQVIINLAINAQEAMPAGGTVTIKTDTIQLDESDIKTKPDLTPGTYVLMEIEDTGTGIDEDYLDRIFDPFFTTKGMAESKGMGLSVALGIIKRHNGRIEVDSQAGEGATFSIYLPAIIEEKVEKPEIEKEEGIAYTGSGESILVVEDDEIVLRYLEDVLSENNYKIYKAENGAQARKIFEKEKENISLLLSDVIMPDINGIELAEELQKEKEDLKVILSSGYSDEKAGRRKIKNKGFQFLQKPYGIENLLEKIRNILT
jgi:PAS domain S-box-containing protein